MSVTYGHEHLDADQWADEDGTLHRDPPPAKTEEKEKKSASTTLVEIAEELYTFGVSDGETFAVPITDPKVVRMLRGGRTSLRAQLSREYFRRVRKAAPQQALADALLVVEGIAQDQQDQQLYLRVARHGGALWLDLGDATGRAVRIADGAWSVRDTAPVLFKRTSLNSALPEPVRGGRLNELWRWLNVVPADQPLVAAWLVSVLYDAMPHPVLGLFGEQGTGKTTAEKLLVSLLDPSPVPTRKPPRDADSWVTAAAGSWVVGLDNLSDVPPWLSDSLCRAVTGDGDVRRKLYTDGDLAVFAFRRCLILNGIDVGAMRGDLAERMLPINLETIRDDHRIEEEDLWPAWEQTHPRLLGALLDLVASVASVLPSVRLARKPRMADFARILAAVDQVLDTDGLSRYLVKQREIADDSLTDDPFITAILRALGEDRFTGTSAELLAKVTPADDGWRPPKGWPGTARKATALLKRQAPPMRKAGWTVENDDGANHDNRVRWTITPPPQEMGRESDSRDSQDSRMQSTASVASLASVECAPSQDKALHPDDDNGCRTCGQCHRPLGLHPVPGTKGKPLCRTCAYPNDPDQWEEAS